MFLTLCLRKGKLRCLALKRKGLSTPAYFFLRMQLHVIADVKSMLSVGLSTISLAGYNLDQVTHRTRNMRILCVGLGGGSLPLFLAHNLPGMHVQRSS